MFFDSLEVGDPRFTYAKPTIKDEIYPLGRLGNLNTFYMPLSGRVVVCDDEFRKVTSIPKYFENNLLSESTYKASPYEYHELALFLTSECNLRCVYCYANSGETQKTLDFEFAKAAMDSIREKSEHLKIIFHGGGEPTLKFKLMKETLEYANEIGFNTLTALQTNGVFSNEVRDWIVKNIDVISISCDGPPSIQDVQRPLKNGGKSSPILEKNIRHFIKNSKNVQLLATISKFSVSKQADILDYFYRLGIKKAKFAPIFQMGRCLSCPVPYSATPNLKSLITTSLKSMDLAAAYNINLTFPILFTTPTNNGKLDELTAQGNFMKHCGKSGKATLLTPDNFVSSCYYAPSADSDRKELLFGYFDKKNKKMIIDNKKLNSLRVRSAKNAAACQNCFMKSNCEGSCIMFPPSSTHCSWVRELGRNILFYRIQKDLIKIKPCLEYKYGKITYDGIFDKFELTNFPKAGSRSSFILSIDLSKTDLNLLADKIATKNPRFALLSFKLSRKKLNTEVGREIETFLRNLKSKHIPFIITKPLPRCLFDQKYDEIIKEFRIPKNCEECLELFTLKGDSFYICGSDKKILQKEVKNRKQIYEIFRKSNRRVNAAPCDRCVYRLRRKCNGLCL